ncbi:MAG TPA: ABC transporter permease [Streptosporangiaceae bacterium]|nr:ABC transporter permease [Streptosporangiaceae bacterium]
MTAPAIAVHQIKYDLRVFLRDPAARVFTFIMPVMLLVVYCSIFANSKLGTGAAAISYRQYFVPRIVAQGITGAALTNLVYIVVTKRENGALKRRRATPVRAWMLITSEVATAIMTAVAIVVALVLIAAFAYGVKLTGLQAAEVAGATFLGTAAMSALGFAVTTFIPSTESAGPGVTLVTFMLYAVSGVYFPETLLPHWVRDIAQVFPVRPLATIVQHAYAPASGHPNQLIWQFLELAAWGVGGIVIAASRFSWVPRHELER